MRNVCFKLRHLLLLSSSNIVTKIITGMEKITNQTYEERIFIQIFACYKHYCGESCHCWYNSSYASKHVFNWTSAFLSTINIAAGSHLIHQNRHSLSNQSNILLAVWQLNQQSQYLKFIRTFLSAPNFPTCYLLNTSQEKEIISIFPCKNKTKWRKIFDINMFLVTL